MSSPLRRAGVAHNQSTRLQDSHQRSTNPQVRPNKLGHPPKRATARTSSWEESCPRPLSTSKGNTWCACQMTYRSSREATGGSYEGHRQPTSTPCSIESRRPPQPTSGPCSRRQTLARERKRCTPTAYTLSIRLLSRSIMSADRTAGARKGLAATACRSRSTLRSSSPPTYLAMFRSTSSQLARSCASLASRAFLLRCWRQS